MYVWFLLPTYPNFFNPTLNIKKVFGEKYLKWALFQILSLFSMLNVITKFNSFPTYLPSIVLVCNRNHTYISFRPKLSFICQFKSWFIPFKYHTVKFTDCSKDCSSGDLLKSVVLCLRMSCKACLSRTLH